MLRQATNLTFLLAIVALWPVRLQAAPKRAAAVPPALEIEILDPGVDPVGNPAVIKRPDGMGQLQIDIPPTVLVHKYYYTGDRKFQGPLLPGGPAIVVVNHPKTGERCYIEMQLLPGAPRVIYCENSIEYDYGKQGITLQFGLCGNPKVVYRNARPATRVIGSAFAGAGKAVYHVGERTGVNCLAEKVAAGTKKVAVGAADGIKTAGTIVVTPIAQAVQILPGVKPLTSSSAEQQALNARDSAVQRAQSRSATADASIPTLR